MISTKVVALIVAACVVGGGVAVGVTVGNVDEAHGMTAVTMKM